jgi:hypothetical protein
MTCERSHSPRAALATTLKVHNQESIAAYLCLGASAALASSELGKRSVADYKRCSRTSFSSLLGRREIEAARMSYTPQHKREPGIAFSEARDGCSTGRVSRT